VQISFDRLSFQKSGKRKKESGKGRPMIGLEKYRKGGMKILPFSFVKYMSGTYSFIVW